MKEIRLSPTQVALVDDEDYEYLSKFKWSAHYANGKWYASAFIKMHRMIMIDAGENQVDHINGDSLDNRRSNLRSVSRSKNIQNSKRYSNNSTGYKGVILRNGRYIARINVEGRRIHLGAFDSPHDAARAYNEAAKEHFGEHCFQNEIIGSGNW